jgi:hypothetical protein
VGASLREDPRSTDYGAPKLASTRNDASARSRNGAECGVNTFNASNASSNGRCSSALSVLPQGDSHRPPDLQVICPLKKGDLEVTVVCCAVLVPTSQSLKGQNVLAQRSLGLLAQRSWRGEPDLSDLSHNVSGSRIRRCHVSMHEH